jgi:hypothetical protein
MFQRCEHEELPREGRKPWLRKKSLVRKAFFTYTYSATGTNGGIFLLYKKKLLEPIFITSYTVQLLYWFSTVLQRKKYFFMAV